VSLVDVVRSGDFISFFWRRPVKPRYGRMRREWTTSEEGEEEELLRVVGWLCLSSPVVVVIVEVCVLELMARLQEQSVNG
jgi:hypothetical protein